MKTMDLAQVGADVMRLVREAQQSDEIIQILEGSEPAAYLLNPQQYEALQAELEHLGRAAEQRDAAEVQAEVQRVSATVEEDVAALLTEPAISTEPAPPPSGEAGTGSRPSI